MKIQKFLDLNPSFNIVIAGNQIQTTFNEALQKQGVGLMEGLVLVAIFFEKEKTARPTQLTDAFGVPKANISYVIRRLEKRKLIKRSMHESDARGYNLELTLKGSQLAVELVSYFDKLQSRLEKKFEDKKLADFCRMLKDVTEFH